MYKTNSSFSLQASKRANGKTKVNSKTIKVSVFCLQFVSTSGVAERFEVEGQLLHTLPGLLIMLRVFWTGYQGNGLSLRNLWHNTEWWEKKLEQPRAVAKAL